MKKLNAGLIGVGGFGRFLLKTYSNMKEIRVLGIADREKPELNRLAKEFGIKYAYTDYEDLLARKELDIAVIATPPFLHAQMLLDAIKSNKHVLCEKPVALSLKDANRIKKALKNSKCRFTMNYVLRKNPIILHLKRIIDNKLLGSVQSFVFENFAGDTKLNKNHWFWDKSKSGGIWVEHGVHFFDVFGFLLSQNITRSVSISNSRNKEMEDEVGALCIYKNRVIGSFLHTFTKPNPIEKTQMLFSFDRGYALVDGWIPESLRIEGAVNDEEFSELRKMFRSAGISSRKSGDKILKGRGKRYNVSRNIRMDFNLKKPKLDIYQDSIREIMLDLVRAVNNPKYKPGIGFEDSLASLKAALLVRNKGH